MNTQELTKKVQSIGELIDLVPEIKTQVEYDEFYTYFASIRDLKKQIKDTFDPLISEANDTVKKIRAKKNSFLEPIEQKEGVLKVKLNKYIEEQRRIAAEAERKRRQEEERLRKEEQERIEAETKKALEEGATAEEFEKIINQEPVIETLPEPVIEKPKFDGRVLGKKKWTFEIIDANKIPREFLCPDEVKIGQYVRAMKENAKIDGIRIWEE